jgi:ATP-dependent RNA helicase DeaD
LEGLSKEELIKKMVSVEFNRFINYYKKNRDISVSGSDRRERNSERAPRENNNGGATRYFVNIGSRDNFDWMSLKDYLKETLDLGRDDVFKVDVKEGFSFFNTDAEHTDKVMDILNNVQLDGRRINVEISKNDGGGRRDHNGRNSGGRRDGGRREGGFRSERREGGFRGERSNSRREGASDRAPRRSESFGDSPRPRRPRRD